MAAPCMFSGALPRNGINVFREGYKVVPEGEKRKSGLGLFKKKPRQKQILLVRLVYHATNHKGGQSSAIMFKEFTLVIIHADKSISVIHRRPASGFDHEPLERHRYDPRLPNEPTPRQFTAAHRIAKGKGTTADIKILQALAA